MQLDSYSHKPLYIQLADIIRDQIESGSLATGERISSEHELARHYGVGRPTVRQATDLLVRSGQLERKRGSGTYVAEGRDAIDLLSLGGTMASFEKSGVPLSTNIVKPMSLHPVAIEDFDGDQAFTMDRTGSVNRKVVLLEQFSFNPKVFPDLDKLDCSGSLSTLVRLHYKHEAIRARQQFSVASADRSRAKAMKCAEGAPLLKVDRTLDFRDAARAVKVTIHCDTTDMAFSQVIQEPV